MTLHEGRVNQEHLRALHSHITHLPFDTRRCRVNKIYTRRHAHAVHIYTQTHKCWLYSDLFERTLQRHFA